LTSSQRALHPRSLQELVDSLLRGLAQRAGDGRGEAVEVGGQLLLEPSLDVHVLVELVDDVDGQRRPDLVGLEQLRARLDPGIRVEHLARHPDGERAHEEDERPEAEQAPGEDRACPRGSSFGCLVGNTHATTIVPAERGSVITPRASSPG
jgi:hypothetical protein